jgi:hypothetical protein
MPSGMLFLACALPRSVEIQIRPWVSNAQLSGEDSQASVSGWYFAPESAFFGSPASSRNSQSN